MKTLIPAPADCEARSMIKFLNAQSVSPIENHHHLRQVYGQTRLDGQHISCRSYARKCLIIIHPMALTSRPVVSIFSYTSRNSCLVSVSIFRMTERRDECHSGFNPRRQSSMTKYTKVGPTVWQMSQFRRWICWKIAQHLLYLFQRIHLFHWGICHIVGPTFVSCVVEVSRL